MASTLSESSLIDGSDGNELPPVSPILESPNGARGCVADEARIHIDNEIAALISEFQSKLCTLRNRRNALSSVFRLPPEILTSIFIHNARTHQQPQRLEWSVPSWVQVSYVCRHWREVALNSPTLWSFLFTSSEKWTNELLARSKAAPLSIRVIQPEHSKRAVDFLKQVAPQADRIQDLALHFLRLGAERFPSLFPLPAPLLRCLRIYIDWPSHYEDSFLTTVPFGGHTPALRVLELINYAFPLTSPTLSGLTFLRLRDLGKNFQPTLAELRVTLDRMHDLVHLHLENALPSAHSDAEGRSLNTSEELYFPRLSRLSIIAPFSTVAHLLSLFNLPLQTEVRLRCCYEPDVRNYTPIYNLLTQRSIDQEHTLAPVIRTCFIESASTMIGFTFSTIKRDLYRRAFSASATVYDLGELHEDWDRGIPLKVDIVLPTSLSRDREEVVGGVCRHMLLTDLESIHFNFDTATELSSGFWTQTFGELDELRYMRLSEVDLLGLAQALIVDPRSSIHFFSALEELGIYAASFRNEHYNRAKSTCSCSVAMTCLYDALASRQMAGCSLKRLDFAKCMYVNDQHHVDRPELAMDITWDSGTSAD